MATFNGVEGDVSPEGFLNFMRYVLCTFVDGEPSERLGIQIEIWVSVVVWLSDMFLSSPIPFHGETWGDFHQKVKLVGITVQVIQRLYARIDGLHTGPNLAKTIITRLLNLCTSLDTWEDVDAPGEEDVPTPQQLRTHAFQVAVDILRHLGSGVSTTERSDPQIWEELRVILAECLDISYGTRFDPFHRLSREPNAFTDIFTPSLPLQYPVTVVFFDKPRFQEAKISDPFTSVGYIRS
jgi:hypothetical protein